MRRRPSPAVLFFVLLAILTAAAAPAVPVSSPSPALAPAPAAAAAAAAQAPLPAWNPAIVGDLQGGPAEGPPAISTVPPPQPASCTPCPAFCGGFCADCHKEFGCIICTCVHH
jgi:hypothetical protein